MNGIIAPSVLRCAIQSKQDFYLVIYHKHKRTRGEQHLMFSFSQLMMWEENTEQTTVHHLEIRIKLSWILWITHLNGLNITEPSCTACCWHYTSESMWGSKRARVLLGWSPMSQWVNWDLSSLCDVLYPEAFFHSLTWIQWLYQCARKSSANCLNSLLPLAWNS